MPRWSRHDTPVTSFTQIPRMGRYADSHPTFNELTILGVLWGRGPSSVKQVVAGLDERFDYEPAHSTIQTSLRALWKKGWVLRRKERHSFYYVANLDRRTVQRESLWRLQIAIFDDDRHRMLEVLGDPGDVRSNLDE